MSEDFLISSWPLLLAGVPMMIEWLLFKTVPLETLKLGLPLAGKQEEVLAIPRHSRKGYVDLPNEAYHIEWLDDRHLVYWDNRARLGRGGGSSSFRRNRSLLGITCVGLLELTSHPQGELVRARRKVLWGPPLLILGLSVYTTMRLPDPVSYIVALWWLMYLALLWFHASKVSTIYHVITAELLMLAEQEKAREPQSTLHPAFEDPVVLPSASDTEATHSDTEAAYEDVPETLSQPK